LSFSLSEEELEEELSLEEESLESLSEESESLELSSLELSGCCCMIFFGWDFKCSLNSSVRPPNPIEVKKLIANLVFFGLSLGRIYS